ncbi:MAG TPA: sigma-70 family RNA polymerase sigma factor [Gemmatimonadaceae bacterium]|nr:sigma-70 family RNA polymerase sigma factor [Gemmatimonadaceae bacterium]
MMRRSASVEPPIATDDTTRVPDHTQERGFERVVLPHLSAGFTLARYLTDNAQDAEDAVQDAIVRAMRYFHTLRGDDARPWFLTIVRRVCLTSYSADYQARENSLSVDEPALQLIDSDETPDTALQRSFVRDRVRAAVDQLPPPLREAIVLRELQGCSYGEIAMITDAPIGTVMSRLSRARERLAALLQGVVDMGDVA